MLLTAYLRVGCAAAASSRRSIPSPHRSSWPSAARRCSVRQPRSSTPTSPPSAGTATNRCSPRCASCRPAVHRSRRSSTPSASRVFGTPIYNQWGLTEFPAATSLGVDDPPSKFDGSRSGGWRPAAELKVVGFDGETVPTGERRRAVRARPATPDRLRRPVARRRCVRRRRLLPHRRPRHDRRRRIRADHRSAEGHHHPQRREPLRPGDRERPVRAPIGRRRGGDRPARRAHRRARLCVRRAGARRARRSPSPSSPSTATPEGWPSRRSPSSSRSWPHSPAIRWARSSSTNSAPRTHRRPDA